jgi:hypothetical protein
MLGGTYRRGLLATERNEEFPFQYLAVSFRPLRVEKLVEVLFDVGNISIINVDSPPVVQSSRFCTGILDIRSGLQRTQRPRGPLSYHVLPKQQNTIL